MISLCKKNKLIFSLIFFCFLIITLWIYHNYSISKIDDWVKIPMTSSEKTSYTVIFMIILFILAWLSSGIICIVKGKPTYINGKYYRNQLRYIGITILFSFPILILFSIFLMSIGNFFSLDFIPIQIVILMSTLLFTIMTLYNFFELFRNYKKIGYFAPVLHLIYMILIFFPIIFIFTTIQTSACRSSSSGLSTGGAKDVNKFRRNIEYGYLPQVTDITYEGLFYDYFFDVGQPLNPEKPFSPTCSTATSIDPISGQTEYYLSLGLKSNIPPDKFKRKKLNLVIVLDISGSMSSQFCNYYYDQHNSNKSKIRKNHPEETKSKMEIANKSIVSMFSHLNPDDRLGVVLFDHSAYSVKPLSLVGNTNMDKIREHILEIYPRGGTNMEEGYKKGTELFNSIEGCDTNDYEDRIIFLTDAMPNYGTISKGGLFQLTKENSEKDLYTSFIGIGIDFNTELVEHITKTRGANYFSVHSNKQFKERMDECFDYMVTPLFFNLNIQFQSESFEIESVYGSPEADQTSGILMKVNTLFPSKITNDKVKGGIIVLKLKKKKINSEKITLKMKYEDRKGQLLGYDTTLNFKTHKPDHYDNSGIRKGILLSRYVRNIKSWLVDARKNTKGIEADGHSKWERGSIILAAKPEFRIMFGKLKQYFSGEIKVLKDFSLEQEEKLLTCLIDKTSK
ncbi:VWA domain-containing protein [bacterium]|nr:VWA domain-containing protein [bacterium]